MANFISPDSLNTASSSLTLRDEIRKEIKAILREEISDLVESEIKNELKVSIKDLMNEVKEEVTQSLYILSNTNTQLITEFSIEAESCSKRYKRLPSNSGRGEDCVDTTVDLISPFQLKTRSSNSSSKNTNRTQTSESPSYKEELPIKQNIGSVTVQSNMLTDISAHYGYKDSPSEFLDPDYSSP